MIKKSWGILLLFSGFILFLIVGVAVVIWATHLSHTIQERLSGKRWAAPTEFYSAPERFLKGQSHVSETVANTMSRLEYRHVLIDRPLHSGEYTQWTGDLCRQKIPAGVAPEVNLCWVFRPNPRADKSSQESVQRPLQVVAVDGNDVVHDVFEGDPPLPTPVVELEPELFAQFYGGQPVLRRIVSLSDVPTYLLNAVIATEDSNFLNHHGVSWTGMMRAAARDVLHGHIAEGGSTITQQLIKNYFLDSRRTFKRKITEILMALILESKFSKDEILETYINEVYLGQEVPFEIHGVGVASRYYFGKRPEDLTLAESALLAAMIRSPHIYSPFNHPDKALTRRNFVLKRMQELNLISPEEYAPAVQAPLLTSKEHVLRDEAPFFIDAVKFQLRKLNMPQVDGLQVFTTLNIRAQAAATLAVTDGLLQLEKQYANIQKLEKKHKAKLESALISADPTNGFVQAVVGGRAYNETQLNRAIQSRRQVGSIFKPFVYLAAFSSNDPTGAPYTPLTQVMDEPFTITYDKQSWSPQNFDDDYEGNVPLYHALEESLNAATAKVELQVGVPKVVEVAHALGIESPLKPFPSLALGAADLTPFEVLQAYSTLAYRGEINPLTFIYRVVGPGHKILYEFQPEKRQAADPVEVAETVSMMEGVIDRGTGRAIRGLGPKSDPFHSGSGPQVGNPNAFLHPAAGKTGTTSDTKDAWFGGFTPLHAAVVWVGFDQPEPTGLTGALGAVPIWLNYMKNYASTYPPIDFQIPDGAVQVTIDPDSAMVATPRCPKTVTLVFKKGQEPTASCWLSH